VLLFTIPGPDSRPCLVGAGSVEILGMAWSRTYLQAHWVSDVVGESLLGIGIPLAVFRGAQHALADERIVRGFRRRRYPEGGPAQLISSEGQGAAPRLGKQPGVDSPDSAVTGADV
jgi:hypothetical protein